MIIDDLRRQAVGDWLELSVRVVWRRTEQRLFVRVPAVMAPSVHDASPFLPPSLLMAMTVGEDLRVDAPASGRLLRGLPAAVTAYATWDRRLRAPEIRVSGVTPPGERAAGIGCFFSRGVDSMFSAALERSEPGPLSHLVFCEDLEPRHGPETAREEIRLAEAAAARLGLPLLRVSSNVRELGSDLRDWADVHGGALAGIGLALGGGLGHVIIPSSDSFGTLGPFGSSPVLDGFYSTESVTIVHDEILLARVGKVACLARDRPDLLPFLKVCFAEDRPDNCGQCAKCLVTMAALQAAGALRLASGFPPVIDLARMRGQSVNPLTTRFHWEAVMRALGGTGLDGELRAAMARALRRSARPPLSRRLRQFLSWMRGRVAYPHPLWRDPNRGFPWAHQALLLSLVHYGREFPPLGAEPEPPLVLSRLRPTADPAVPRPVGGPEARPRGEPRALSSGGWPAR